MNIENSYDYDYIALFKWSAFQANKDFYNQVLKHLYLENSPLGHPMP